MKGKKIVALLSFLASMSLLAACGVTGDGSESTASSQVNSESSVSASVEEHTHEYDNDCDDTCNTCDETRDTEHTYDNACDVDCNVCGDERTASHEYDNACDVECNICGEARVPGEHDYDNDCDPDCNDCGEKREVGDHIYDNACDLDCNECGEKREVGDHVYDNGCDIECNECGENREVGDHVYDDNRDDSCNECGEIRELPLTGEEDVATVLWNSATNVDTIGIDPNEHWASKMTKATVDNTAIPAGYTGNATSFFKLENMEGAFLYFNAEKPAWYYEALKGKDYMVAFDLYIETDVEWVSLGGKAWRPNEWLTRGDGSNILKEGEMDDGNVVLLDDLLENPEKVLINVWGAEGNSYLTFYIGNFRIVEKEKEPEALPPLTGDEDISTVVWNSATNVNTVGRAEGSWGSTQATVVDNTAIPAGYTGDATSFFKLTGSVGDKVYFTSDGGVDYYTALKGKGYLVAFDFYMETEGEFANSDGKQVKPNTWLTRGDGSNILREGEMKDGNLVSLDALLDNPQMFMFDIWGIPGDYPLTMYVGNFRIFEVVEEEPEELPPLTGDEDIATIVWNSATNANTVGRAEGSWGSTQATVVDNTAIPAGYTGDATSFFKLTGSEGDRVYFTSDYGVDYYAALKGKGYLVAFDIYVSTDVSVNFAGKNWKTNTWLTRGDGSSILNEGEMDDGNLVALDTLLDNPQTFMFDVWGANGNTYFEIYVGNFRIVDPNAGTETPEEPTEQAWVWNTVNADVAGAQYMCNGNPRDWSGTIEYVTEIGGKTGAFYKVSCIDGTFGQMNGISVMATNDKGYYEQLLALDPEATFSFSFYYEDGKGAGVLSVNGTYNIGLANYAPGQWHTLSVPVATLVANYNNLINGSGDENGALVAICGATDMVTFYVGDFAINTTAGAPSETPEEDPAEDAFVWNTVNADVTGARYVCNGGNRDWAGSVTYVTEVGDKTGAFYQVTSTEEGTYMQCNGIAVAAVNEKSYYEELLALDPEATFSFSFYYEDGAGAGVLTVNGTYNIGLANYAVGEWHTISISLATLVENYDNLINGAGEGMKGALIGIEGATASVTFYVGDFAINTTAEK